MNFSFFYETFRLALVNLTLHKLRSFLTTLGIVFGVLAVIVMMAIGEGGKRETLKEVEQLGASNIIVKSVPPPESPSGNTRRDTTLIFGLKRSDFDAIRAELGTGMLKQVDLAVPLRESGLDIVRNDKRADSKCSAVATTPDFITVANLSLDHGRFLAAGDMFPEKSPPVCVLGAGIAEQLFGKEDPIDSDTPKFIRLQTTSGNKPFAVVGVLKPVGLAGGKGSAMIGRDLNYDLYFPLALDATGAVKGDGAFGDTFIKRTQGTREAKNELSQIYLRVTTLAALRPIASALDRMMQTRHAGQSDVALAIPLELMREYEETQRVWDVVLFVIACLALLVGGIGIMNITLATVTERTREIGIRRALGGKKRHIITQFLIETTTLSTIGGVLGVVAGFAAPPLITWIVALFSGKSMPTYVTISSAVVSFTISATVGILAGLYPAIVAANKDPIESLRHD